MERNKNENTTSLTERMDKIAKQYNGIWLITEDKLSDLRDAIDIESQREEQIDNLISSTR